MGLMDSLRSVLRAMVISNHIQVLEAYLECGIHLFVERGSGSDGANIADKLERKM